MRVVRESTALLLTLYIPLAAFALWYPYCHANFESESVCYLGDTNYGRVYATICWHLALAFPAVVALLLISVASAFRERSSGDVETHISPTRGKLG